MGKRGKGKTSLAKKLVRAKPSSKIFIFDYMGEYSDLSNEYISIYYYDTWLFCKEVWEKAELYKNTIVVFDEINRYGQNNEDIHWLYDLGRHKNIDIIAVSRRIFADLPVYVRSGTERYIFFQITEPVELDYIKKHSSEEFAAAVRNLGFLEYISLDL
ncbi:MAG: ATP-binding protein [Candidatus Helarchaeota archaeon]|nr:ATP-binding protein [Candidatus Helarchaeota archaeon]